MSLPTQKTDVVLNKQICIDTIYRKCNSLNIFDIAQNKIIYNIWYGWCSKICVVKIGLLKDDNGHILS